LDVIKKFSGLKSSGLRFAFGLEASFSSDWLDVCIKLLYDDDDDDSPKQLSKTSLSLLVLLLGDLKSTLVSDNVVFKSSSWASRLTNASISSRSLLKWISLGSGVAGICAWQRLSKEWRKKRSLPLVWNQRAHVK
jgi:hypothetical protein